ncbi:MAG TPA: LysR family transcriptional regulator [Archaeoglobaceae archaeon]|nr:LysR family transcriptional regulator [Archaeoglobaceae archaeon]
MKLRLRFWFEKDGKPVLGKGGAEILEAIDECGSISKAAKSLGMSYRFVWNYVEKMENRIGRVVERERGGRGGGGAKLTDLGKSILEEYLKVQKKLEEISESFESESEGKI